MSSIACLEYRPKLQYQTACTKIVLKRGGEIRVRCIKAARTKPPHDANGARDKENTHAAGERAGEIQVPRVLQTAARTREHRQRAKSLLDPERASESKASHAPEHNGVCPKSAEKLPGTVVPGYGDRILPNRPKTTATEKATT